MSTEELFRKITSEHKWYAGKMAQQTASTILKRHNQGVYTNYAWLFSLFGYEVQTSWKKKEETKLYFIVYSCGFISGKDQIEALNKMEAKELFMAKVNELIPADIRKRNLLAIDIY